MYHVLLGVDEDEDLAKRVAGAAVTLPNATADVRVSIFHSFTDNPTGAAATQIAAVRRARERLEEAGIQVDVLEGSGNPADTLLDVAAEHDVDLILIGGKRRSPAGKALFGSVAQSIILNADRPVMVAGQTE